MTQETSRMNSENACQLLTLIRRRFDRLNDDERALVLKAAAGDPAQYPSDEPLTAVIRADRLAFLCTDRAAIELLAPTGIHITGARISGDLQLQAINLPYGLTLERCKVEGDIDLQAASLKWLELIGTEIQSMEASNLHCAGDVCLSGKFDSDDWDLSARYAEPPLQYFVANGTVSLMGAFIGRDLDCEGAKFLGNKGDKARARDGEEDTPRVLSADRAHVEGCALLRRCFSAKGTVAFIGATVKDHFAWTHIDHPSECVLDLRNASVNVLSDRQCSWPDRIRLNGFQYDFLAERAPATIAERSQWLRSAKCENEKGDPSRFYPQPYEQLATVLERSGHDHEAKDIRIAKNDDPAYLRQINPWAAARNWLSQERKKRHGIWRSRACTVPFVFVAFFLRRLLHSILGGTISYGYRPWGVLPFMLAFIVWGAVLFGVGQRAGLMSPAKVETYCTQKAPPAEPTISPDYPAFSPWGYSVDAFVPLVDLRQVTHWLPNPSHRAVVGLPVVGQTTITGRCLRWYFWAHIAAGWILTTLLVVGLTGLVRR